jgi:hypothetical protein
MLTEEHRILLSKAASTKYRLNINSTQIAHLILDKFECTFHFGKQNNFIKGKVENFRKFPLRMDFDIPEGSPGREMLKSKLQQNIDLKFSCKLSSVSHTTKINTLTILSNEFQEMGIKEKLLGPASSTFVSRQQLNQLAGQVYTSLNVFEDYEMPEYQFQQNFVDDFIRLATDQHFQHVPALQVLKELSSYGINIGQDIQAGKMLIQILYILRGKNVIFCEMIVFTK